ncbi:mitochondrial chaperone BCS1 [Pochonia chlamydosporia 170]|uniref:Mitochondrial chaperone BCS1 n=1 Tax=Pochonia chlamydosporia 170 TaxID=1380566 RepID=A0A179FIC4_METCM|nr:mitochondrial chaperone BCS1 [Pochonia chlamydosporia 170]OAQ64991.1 mitochondrial chaperone BCS1 [Pochonia chlamydosporia 170]
MNFQLPSIFQHAVFNTSAMNGSGPTGSGGQTGPFPAGVMDSFLATAGRGSPLLQVVLVIYRILGSQLGVDPSILLTLLGFFWGLSKLVSQVYAHVATFVDRHFMCAMYVSEYDHIYSHLMKWLSQHQSIRNSQFLMAQTVWKSAWEEEEELESALFFTDGGDTDSGRQYLNFSNQAARSSPRFVPAMGATYFWHNGTFFRVHRRKESVMATSGWGATKDTEEIRISCFGRSIEPVKRLLSDAKHLYYNDTRQKTTIYRPKQKELRRDHSMWQQVARRPVRPMQTVVLDSEEKHGILADVNEYLHPATPKWYASRGIPLRRGYLFHGPPGTGKTSFSFALAGVFGIDIYVISLQDINVTEEDLAALFTRLPRRCIVLLEDIDTAGLRRDGRSDEDGEKKDDATKEGVKADEKTKAEDGEKTKKTEEAQVNGVSNVKKEESEPKTNGTKDKSSKKKKSKKKDESSDESDQDSEDSDDSSEDERRARRRRKARKNAANKSKNPAGKKVLAPENISLSGLLNAIDGVASHEGRVLIMTTNKPESLDEALIRPGRVDVQVGFKNASSQQAGELFYRMYEAVAPPKPLKNAPQLNKAAKDKKLEKMAEILTPQGQKLDITPEELRKISEEFGEQIPEGMFSPAEIQGFLLKRKKDPRKALEDANSWVEGLLKQKQTHSKVVTVQ